MSAALDSQVSRGPKLLLAHCVALSRFEETRAPVFERLRELIGAELTRLLLFALAGGQRARSPRRPG